MLSKFSEIIKEKGFLLLDGASGTYMQDAGMPSGESPEIFALNNADILTRMQRGYYDSGSDMVYTFTFGGNSPKLKRFGMSDEEMNVINTDLAGLTCSVRDEYRVSYPRRHFFVAGDIAPTGEFLRPAGDMSFNELKEVYKVQAAALAKARPDLFIVETMMDLHQTKAAVTGIREASDLPIFVTMTFEGERTLSGNTPEACTVALRALGVEAFGANCSAGPEEMYDVIRRISDVSDIPVIAKPNAGMPVEKDGRTVFPMDPENFAVHTSKLYEAGARILGGCCGTTPEHIAELGKKLSAAVISENRGREEVRTDTMRYISSGSQITAIGEGTSYCRVCPADVYDIADLLLDAQDDDPDCIVLDLTELEKSGADKVSVEEEFAMAAITITTPLGISCADPAYIEILSGAYPGRLLYAKPDEIELTKEHFRIADRSGVKVV